MVGGDCFSVNIVVKTMTCCIGTLCLGCGKGVDLLGGTGTVNFV